MDGKEENLSEFLECLSQPEDFAALLLTDKNDKQKLLIETCQKLFRRIEAVGQIYSSTIEKKNHEKNPIVLSGLDELYTGLNNNDGDTEEEEVVPTSVDAETLWGQVDLQNQSLSSLLKKSIRKLSKAASSSKQDDKNSIRILEDIPDTDEESTSVNGGDGEEDNEEEDESDGDEEEADEETKRIQARMERAMADMDEDEGSVQSNKVTKTVDEDEESLDDPAANELNDGFFSIKEMEAFADEEEEYLPDDAFGPVNPEKDIDEDEKQKKTFHQKQRDGDFESDSDGEDETEDDDNPLFRKESGVRRRKYRDDDEIEALLGLYDNEYIEGEDEDDSVEDYANMTASDLFGTPNKKYFGNWKANRKGKEKNNDDDSWNEYAFENDREQKKEVRWNDGDLKSAADDSDEDAEEKEHVDEKTEKRKAPTKQLEKIEIQTEKLEKEMLAEKPWQMVGEAASGSRPINSLLESTPEFEVATKMAPIITVEQTADLEEVIKKRILNEDWDDVIPRELPDVGWNQKKGEVPEVSQEKSKLGLGELYEREYLKKAVGYDVDRAEKETEEDKAKNEMKSLFANLCSKLDALSNYHFAPRPLADEADVKPLTQPAIAMEEVLPLHVSNARGVAPEEVYASKRGREGILRTDTELDQHDRKRLRRAKKAARRKSRQEKQADEKLISRLQPGNGLANPYEKRKIRDELSVARAGGKIVVGKEDVNANAYGASGTFFQRMQAEAIESIKGSSTEKGGKEDKKRTNGKSSSLKL